MCYRCYYCNNKENSRNSSCRNSDNNNNSDSKDKEANEMHLKCVFYREYFSRTSLKQSDLFRPLAAPQPLTFTSILEQLLFVG